MYEQGQADAELIQPDEQDHFAGTSAAPTITRKQSAELVAVGSDSFGYRAGPREEPDSGGGVPGVQDGLRALSAAHAASAQ